MIDTTPISDHPFCIHKKLFTKNIKEDKEYYKEATLSTCKNDKNSL